MLLVLLLLHLVLSSKVGEALELGRGESIGRAGLERAPEKQLGGQKRGEVHVEPGARRLQVGVVVARSEPASVNARNVGPFGMPVSIAGLVRVEGSVGEASVASVHLLLEAVLETGSARGGRGAIVVVHSGEVRGQDEVVPRVLR